MSEARCETLRAYAENHESVTQAINAACESVEDLATAAQTMTGVEQDTDPIESAIIAMLEANS